MWTILEIVFHPQAVPCLAHQYGLEDWFSRLKMNIFHPVSFMCLARYFNSSNKLLEKKIFFVVKSSTDIPIYVRIGLKILNSKIFT